MITHDINPVLLSLGSLQIRYYGLVYAAGFIIAYMLLKRYAPTIKNFSASKADDLIIYITIGMMIGARAFTFLFYYPQTLLANPLEFFYIWHGGMSFHGAIVGSALAAWLFCRKHNVEFYKIADLLVIPSAFFLFVGRIANFINGELYGTLSNMPFCVDYSKSSYIANPPQGCRHPSQLYEAAKNLFIFASLIIMKAKLKLRDGVLFWSFILLYGVLRMLTNFFREDPRWIGLSMGQWLSVPMILLGAYFLYKLHKRGA